MVLTIVPNVLSVLSFGTISILILWVHSKANKLFIVPHDVLNRSRFPDSRISVSHNAEKPKWVFEVKTQLATH